jgi:hypothetical protein
MIRTVQNKSGFSIKQTVDQIIASGQMTRQEHLQLASAILSDYKVTDEERRYINRIFDYIQMGRLKLVD